MKSVWSASCEFKERVQLHGDINSDVVVIGAGMAGILTAFMLQEKGLKVVVLEASKIAGGMTKNTTAKITSQHNLIYNKLLNSVGEEKAKQYYFANELAIKMYKELIDKNHIECDYEEKPAYVYALDDDKKIQDEVTAANKLGITAEFCQKTTLPFQVKGAIKFPKQAQFNPLKFLKPLAEKLTIYEDTLVKSIDKNTVITDGGSVKASSIVVATHFPFINVPGYYFVRMYQSRSYVIALSNTPQLDGMYLDANPGFSFRNYGNLLLLGGGGHQTGKNNAGGRYNELRTAAKQWYPNSIEEYSWSAQDCMSLDSIPYIGQYSSSTPNLYVATGFNKWGMTSSMVSALILSDMITDKTNSYSEVFSPHRFNVTASMKNLASNTAQAVSGLTNEIIKIPSENLTDIEKGHGGIIEYNGQKVGVYKDNNGQVFTVSTKCTHLGCQLEWNPDELSWDCPCHGSRFDYMGNLINNPAIKRLDSGNKG